MARSAYEIGYHAARENKAVVVLLAGQHHGERCVFIRSYPCSPGMRERIRSMDGPERALLAAQLAFHCATDARRAGVVL